MKICVATGTRAEYGLLKPLIGKIKTNPQFQLQLLVTGSHLSPEFGLTYKQIEADGLTINYKVDMQLSDDTAKGVTKSMGIGMIGFADAFTKLQPELLVILGDRYEMLSLASTALIFKIPIAHIHGGEVTEGAYDDAIRHSISKMSHLHFTSTEAYENRVIQLGEEPETVFNVGAIGLDNIANLTLLTKEQLETDLKIKFKRYNYLITFHPETLADEGVEEQFNKLLAALNKLDDSFFIFTKANADTGGKIINRLCEKYAQKNSGKSVLFDSLGSLRYLSVMKICDTIVGNSSSGIIEAPSLHTATVNIGNRQKGRIQAKSVLNCETDTEAIFKAIKHSNSKEFQSKLKDIINPYGTGKASEQIVEVLDKIDLSTLRTKKFYNIK